ncbi:MAG: M50 family metallopeptidase [Clostridiales bacterium]|nr:M50 family metallopeptidase [Clostridiales bacterium]
MLEVFETILNILGAVVLLCVLVTVHELGHFGMGRLLGFRIEEFAIGMGPKVFSRKKNGTVYALRALPIGGMCRFYGEDETQDSSESFHAQKPWKRFLVILAGPAINIVFTVVLAAVFLMAYGVEDGVSPVVTEFAQDSKARTGGMTLGDRLYAVDGVVIENYEDTVNMIRAAGSDMVITVWRGGELRDIALRGTYNAGLGYNSIGVVITYMTNFRRCGFFEAAGKSVPFVAGLVRQLFQAIGGMFQNGVRQGDIVGAVGTVAVMSQAIKTGFDLVLYIMIFLGISLAVMNLLPLPALDGGKLIFILIELARGKPVPPEKEGMVHFVGLVLLLGLVVLITISDIKLLIGG